MKKDFYLAPIFQDNIIFQANQSIRIFGKSKIGITIKIEFLSYRYEFKTYKEEFLFTLAPLSVRCVPFNLKISSENNTEIIKNCLVGDVFYCGGQSNMAFTVSESENINIEEYDNLRFFEVPKLPYENAEVDFPNLYQKHYAWKLAKADNIKYFSALAYLMAKDLIKTKDIPIGIISCNMGDTTIFTWIEEEVIKQNPVFNEVITAYNFEYKKFKSFEDYQVNFKKQLPLLLKFYDIINDGASKGLDSKEAHNRAFNEIPNPFLPMGPLNQNRPGGLFDVMVKELIPYSFKAFVYYQGESDKLLYHIYLNALEAMVKSYREKFDNYFPVIIIQLAGYNYLDVDELAVAILKDQQLAFQDLAKKQYLVSASDLGERDNIHPKDKSVLAKRISNVIKEYLYYDQENSLSPEFKYYIFTGDSVIIKTKNNSLPLVKKSSGYFTGINTEGKTVELNDYKIIGNDIHIDITRDIVEIRYAYEHYPNHFIYTTNDLPLLPFRIRIEVGGISK